MLRPTVRNLPILNLENQSDRGAWVRKNGGWLLVGLALVLRLADAALASFHLDDFHSLYHAQAATMGEFLRVLGQDNHPPLSFLVLRGLRSIVGDNEFLLRLPNVVYGTLSVALVWRISRRLSGELPRIVGTAFFALSSLHLDLSSDLRMYALLGLCSLGILDSLLDVLAPHGSGRYNLWTGLRLTLWSAAALLSHYHALHLGLVLAVLVMGLWMTRQVRAEQVRRTLLWVALALLLVSPWYFTGFRAQLAHDLPPGSSSISIPRLGESFVHLIFVRLELLGPLRDGLLVLGLLTFPLAWIGAWAAFKQAREQRDSTLLPVLLAGLAFLVPLWSAAVAWLQPRAGFEWRYLAAAIGPYCLLLGAAASSGRMLGVRRSLLGLCLAGAAALSAAHILDPGREGYRAAAQHILATAVPGEGVLCVEWSPALFPHGLGWTYYAAQFKSGAGEDQQGQELLSLDHTADFRLAPDVRLGELPGVHCLLRSIPNDVPLLQRLRSIYPVERKARFGEAIWVLSFSRE